MEKFEQNVKNGHLDDNVLKNLEGEKMKILTTFTQTPNIRVIKVFVTKMWNLCKMLNFTRNIKDIDNNFLLLRLKDFLCDFFGLVFNGNTMSEVTFHDVFNFMQMTVEVGNTFIKLEMQLSSEAWVKKIDNIMT